VGTGFLTRHLRGSVVGELSRELEAVVVLASAEFAALRTPL